MKTTKESTQERTLRKGPPVTTAIIGGSAAWLLVKDAPWQAVGETVVETPYGPSPVIRQVRWANGAVSWFVSRHGDHRYAVSAPFVNTRAILWALKSLGAERVLAWSGPGSLRPKRLKPGDLALPDDVIDETRNRPSTFFEGRGQGFIRAHPVFCPEGRRALAAGVLAAGRRSRRTGVYVCTEGPRLETPAEIRKYRLFGGDLVGMTLCPEAFLAKELELCYAPLCYVTNYAEGLVRRPVRPEVLFGGMLSEAERQRVDSAVAAFPAILGAAVAAWEKRPRRCTCGLSLERYRREGVLTPDWWKKVNPVIS